MERQRRRARGGGLSGAAPAMPSLTPAPISSRWQRLQPRPVTGRRQATLSLHSHHVNSDDATENSCDEVMMQIFRSGPLHTSTVRSLTLTKCGLFHARRASSHGRRTRVTTRRGATPTPSRPRRRKRKCRHRRRHRRRRSTRGRLLSCGSAAFAATVVAAAARAGASPTPRPRRRLGCRLRRTTTARSERKITLQIMVSIRSPHATQAAEER